MRISRAALYAALCALGAIACTDVLPPAIGAIRVQTSTSGIEFDVDGYGLRVGDEPAVQVEATGSIIIGGLTAGTQRLRISGLATNCHLTSSSQLSVTVVASDTVDAKFSALCSANVGVIYVQPANNGPDPDQDGYLVSVDGGLPKEIPIGGGPLDTVRVGAHTVTLGGLATNCVAQSPTVTATVDFSQTTTVHYSVACVARTGHLEVHTTTTGVDTDDAYAVDVPFFGARNVPADGTVTIDGIHEGSPFVTLTGVNPNCTVSGSNPRQVSIAFQASTPLSFQVNCVAATRLRVTAATTGADADPAYRVRVTGANIDRVEDLPAQGSVTLFALGEGSHAVTLEDVAVNCEVAATSPNPRTVTLVAATTTDVSFDVACAAAKQIAFIRWMSGLEVFVAKTSGTSETRLTNNNVEEHDPAYSADGSKIVFRSYRDGNSEIYIMNADGSAQVRLTTNPADDLNPEWSPDGTKIAFRSHRDGNAEIYVMNADGSGVTRLTNNAAFDHKPTWSPDGSKIAFTSGRSGNGQIWVMNGDGSNVTRLTNSAEWADLPAWSPDGTRIAFVRFVECDDYYSWCHNIHVMNADGTGEVRFETRSHDSEPAWSSDGKWIAFETRYCDYYSCYANGISAVKSDGKGRTMILAGDLYNPTWRP